MKKSLFLIPCLFVFAVSAQNQTPYGKDSLKTELNNIQTEIETLKDKLYELQNDQIENKSEIIETRELAISKNNNFFTRHFEILMIVAALIGGFMGFFGINKYLKKTSDDLLNKLLISKLEELKEQDINTLYQEIESSAWKNTLRNKKILVLNQTDTTMSEDFKKAVKVFNPEYKDIVNVKDGLSINYKKYALVILENMELKGFWDLNLLKNDLIELTDHICKKNVAFIYYGKPPFPPNNINTNLVNFSNSPSTLYNNVMNMLKYQDILKKA